MSKGLIRLGDPSNHGGTVTTASADIICEGIQVARVGEDYHSCPIPGHGTTLIVSNPPGSAQIHGEKGNVSIAIDQAWAACGANISSTVAKTTTGNQ